MDRVRLDGKPTEEDLADYVAVNSFFLEKKITREEFEAQVFKNYGLEAIGAPATKRKRTSAFVVRKGSVHVKDLPEDTKCGLMVTFTRTGERGLVVGRALLGGGT